MVKDWAYIARFDSKDLPSLQQMIYKINETHDGKLIEDFNSKCEQKLRGGNPEGFESVTVEKSEDLTVNVGLQHCINLILGTLSTRWRYMAWKVGVDPGTTPAVSDTTLQNYNPPTDVPTDMSLLGGWSEAVGMKLFFGAIIGEDDSFGSIGEIGVVNSASASFVLLNRSKFVKNRVITVSDPTGNLSRFVVMLSVVVEFCPVA